MRSTSMPKLVKIIGDEEDENGEEWEMKPKLLVDCPYLWYVGCIPINREWGILVLLL